MAYNAEYHRRYYLEHGGKDRKRIVPGHTVTEKRCPSCGIVKTRDEYTIQRTAKRRGHLSAYCKQCRIQKLTAAKARDPSIYRRIEWPSKLRRQYGIEPEDYERMLAQQGGGCAICGIKDPSRGFSRRAVFAVDHCHDTGRVRGLLCSPCNQAIGLLEDDPERITRVLQYLTQEK